ncbi:WD repeat-containing protein 74 isoform X1 [Drosophila teissieri]|uniref:WD repeat-containing protein 74 isoform X1 n=1 Tax=Drosophila teissieri TaxID=7243 RepID=UPI001CBA0A1E|nr:WD repeat-containing protein 74 isoform X1 [Drosophila teissieri]
MKWTTANIKHVNYTAKHELYVGTHTGSFKHLVPASDKTPYGQSNLSDLCTLGKDSRITSLAFGNDDQAEILLGRTKDAVEIHSFMEKGHSRKTLSFNASPIVGLARYNDMLIAGIGNGQIQSLKLGASDVSEPMVITTGNQMDHLRQCTQVRSIVATGGKERQNNLKVYDLNSDGKQIFTSKNLPNDYLQLEVPVWDSDIGFVDGPSVLATCSRTGYVRIYDTRMQRRPVTCFASEEHGMSFTTLVAKGNFVYTGTTMGALKAFDTRRMKTHVHTYKGFTGGISDLHLDTSGRFLSSASLDRYVRIHDSETTVLLYQCYVKSKATKILIRQFENEPGVLEESEEAAELQVDRYVGKNKSVNGTFVDSEYEHMFDQMPTVGDSDESEEGTSDIKHSKANLKRKSLGQSLKIKKKKVANS